MTSENQDLPPEEAPPSYMQDPTNVQPISYPNLQQNQMQQSSPQQQIPQVQQVQPVQNMQPMQQYPSDGYQNYIIF